MADNKEKREAQERDEQQRKEQQRKSQQVAKRAPTAADRAAMPGSAEYAEVQEQERQEREQENERAASDERYELKDEREGDAVRIDEFRRAEPDDAERLANATELNRRLQTGESPQEERYRRAHEENVPAKTAGLNMAAETAAADENDDEDGGAGPVDPVKVQAVAMGYYDHTRRRPGDVFTIRNAKHFSKRWMRRVPDDTPEHVTNSAQALKSEHADIRAAKQATGDRNPIRA
jgi:hypothetical protein